MKLKDIKDIKKFFEFVDRCNKDVYVVEGGSKLSLKSKLCRLIISAKINNKDIDNCILEFEDENDYKKYIGE